MSPVPPMEIIPGTIVEFFENRQILCGVCTALKGNRPAILTEQNKEISLAQSRILHASSGLMDLSLSRDEQVRRLQGATAARKDLMELVNVEELWSLLESEEEGYDVRGLAEFVFSQSLTDHHVAAVQRVLLHDRLYFQFKDGLFHARSQEKVELRRVEMEREAEREARIESGAQWVHAVWNRRHRGGVPEEHQGLIETVKSYCLFGQDSVEAAFVKELFRRAGIAPVPGSAFRLLVRLGVWKEDENLYLHEQNITPEFPGEVLREADALARTGLSQRWDPSWRRDLRALDTFTIDSALTRDHDDALSLRTFEDGTFEVGIHIADVAEFVAPGEPLDREAEARASSIYLPDSRISMLPPILSEDLCSLKSGEDRFALSFMLRVDGEGAVRGQEIVLSVIRIREQLTYEDVNERIGDDPVLGTLYDLAVKARKRRIERGAIILPLPEIHVHVNPVGMIQMSRYEKESPSQIMVSEWMIAANAVTASFLAERGLPSVYRVQAECKPETDPVASEHAIFHVYRQRRLFARAEMDTQPRPHCSLALSSYTMATSPIRRYTDLVVQRQIRHLLLGRENPYSEEDLRQLITRLAAVQSKIFLIQRKWTRYWILKYMEQEDMHTMDALVLDQNDRFAHVLLPELLMEANLPLPEKAPLQRGSMVRVKIERINPRDDVLRIQL
ncbi:MAG: ribonuclease catalytic domain-containing protein [Syntrophobacteraceae bacterium]|jgi:exoribonuclease-2|nr:ribonuclease catalytic domain-containing protein [Syntrophobacteraceae bacterium]